MTLLERAANIVAGASTAINKKDFVRLNFTLDQIAYIAKRDLELADQIRALAQDNLIADAVRTLAANDGNPDQHVARSILTLAAEIERRRK